MANKKNLLDVQGAADMINQYKEEMAHEFGVHHSVQEQDAKAKDMTKTIQEEKNKKND
ncbi:hypothetical protein [Geomicrobium sp. JCM 19055]|uniref:hypothetical protein n=1 Tax=Geomicrobium sp. JCM 19055 TaxID=1460649 RepID=UPI00045ECD2C|nr:hypothetical protein [Geomicrobium sp. JCM 19055]GAK00299.1 hypothetical protein JCM19055_3382 [Geomicrobium sp. JCM 19055]